MFEKYFSRNFKEDEELIKIIRPCFITYFLRFLFAMVLLLLPFFLLFLLFQLGFIGFLIWFCLIFVGIFVFVRILIIWGRHAIVLTNRRVIDFDQNGLFSRTVSETSYSNIVDVSYVQKGFFATVFDFGSVMVQTSGPKSNIELENVKAPDKVKEEVSNLIEEAKLGRLKKP